MEPSLKKDIFLEKSESVFDFIHLLFQNLDKRISNHSSERHQEFARLDTKIDTKFAHLDTKIDTKFEGLDNKINKIEKNSIHEDNNLKIKLIKIGQFVSLTGGGGLLGYLLKNYLGS